MSIITPTKEPCWSPATQKQWQMPRALAPWLTDQGSLTARLIEHSQQQFEVVVIAQGWGRARTSEARLLRCAPRQQMLVREVVLMGRGQPWVFARSLIPVSSLNGRLKALKQLDNRPLGALLFQHPNMHRDPIEVATIGAEHDYVKSAAVSLASSDNLWGRRSVFYLDENPLMVSEVFLPAFTSTLAGSSDDKNPS